MPAFDPCASEAPWAQAWTLAGPTAPVVGHGLHSGAHARVQVWPAEAHEGLHFVVHREGRSHRIPARVEAVVDTQLATTLGAEGQSVATVEHLMAALWGMGLVAACVELEGPEVPAVDGSAAPWVEVLREAQAVALPQPRPLAPLLAHREGQGQAWLEGQPPEPGGPARALRLAVDFPHPAVGAQALALELSALPEAFARELAGARTFGAKRDWARLQAAGKALGATACNCVPLEEEGPMVPWRWPDEVARHKALDALGDLALAGLWWEGTLSLHHAGHGLHVAYARALAAQHPLEAR